MKRDFWQIVSYFVIAACVALWGSQAFGQLPHQPGDTPAPVVTGKESLQVAEHNELVAKITGPETARAGSIIEFDVSGSSDEDQELVFRPQVPDDAIVWDSAGEIVYAAVFRPGHYTAVWSVETEHAAAVALWSFEVVEGEPPDPGDDPPDPPPGDTALLKYVEALAAAVEADSHDTVAETFRGIALRIELDQLKGSQPIYDATKAALFGKNESQNAPWKSFFNALMPHLLNVKRLDSQGEWQAAYEVIARGIVK